jgi:hypothetical protein
MKLYQKVPQICGSIWRFKHRRPLEPQMAMTKKESLYITLQLKCQDYREKKLCLMLQEKNTNLPTNEILSKSHQLLAETLKIGEVWNDLFQVVRVNNCQTKLLYAAKLSFKTERNSNIPN